MRYAPTTNACADPRLARMTAAPATSAVRRIVTTLAPPAGWTLASRPSPPGDLPFATGFVHRERPQAVFGHFLAMLLEREHSRHNGVGAVAIHRNVQRFLRGHPRIGVALFLGECREIVVPGVKDVATAPEMRREFVDDRRTCGVGRARRLGIVLVHGVIHLVDDCHDVRFIGGEGRHGEQQKRDGESKSNHEIPLLSLCIIARRNAYRSSRTRSGGRQSFAPFAVTTMGRFSRIGEAAIAFSSAASPAFASSSSEYTGSLVRITSRAATPILPISFSSSVRPGGNFRYSMTVGSKPSSRMISMQRREFEQFGL